MKQHPSYDMDGESRDLLLFDYLEGNLTAARALELEAALSHDPELQAELESWKESFVIQDFYPTAALESQLLKLKPKPYSFFGPSAGFLLVLMTSLFSFLPVGDQPESIGLPLPVTSAISAVEAENVYEQDEIAQISAQETRQLQVPKADRLVSARITEAVQVISKADAEGELPLLKGLSSADVSSNDEKGVVLTRDIIKVKQKKLHQPKEISRKQQRQITKMKEKALQRRKANEFLKGNKPYVVPLDTKNF